MNVCSVCRRCYEESVAACDIVDHGALAKARSGDCQIVTGYKIDSQIKSHSPVALYKASHLASGKTVLIKFIDFSTANCSREDLESEIRAIIQTNHPNLARVFEFGSVNENEIYVVLEDVSGLCLRDYLEKLSPLPERNAIKIVRQIAEALEALHKNGQIHRAVNPSNIYFASHEKNDFSVKLNNYDFGGIDQKIVAAGASGVDARTEIFRYFSPEQFTEEKIDFRSDLYNLAVVFYEMLLGHSPYSSLNPQSIADYVFNESDVEKLHFDLRALLAYTLKQSLQHRLNLRPPTTNNLARQLRHIELIATPPSIGIADTSKNQTKQTAKVSQVRKPQPSIKLQPFIQPIAAPDEINISEPEIIKAENLNAITIDEPLIISESKTPITEDIPAEINVEEISEPETAPEIYDVSEVSGFSPVEEEKLIETAIEEPEILDAQIYDAALDTKDDFDSELIDTFDSAGDEDTSEQIHITNKDFDDNITADNYSLESDVGEFEEVEEFEIDERATEKESVTDRYIANTFGAYAQPQASYFNKTSAYAAGIIALIIFGGFITTRVWTSQSAEKTPAKNDSPPVDVVTKIEQPAAIEQTAAAPVKSSETAEIIEDTAPLPQYDGPAETEISKTDEEVIPTRINKNSLNESAPKSEKRLSAPEKEKLSKPLPGKEIVKTPAVKKQIDVKTQNNRNEKPAVKTVAEKIKPAVKKGDGMTRPRIVTNLKSAN